MYQHRSAVRLVIKRETREGVVLLGLPINSHNHSFYTWTWQLQKLSPNIPSAVVTKKSEFIDEILKKNEFWDNIQTSFLHSGSNGSMSSIFIYVSGFERGQRGLQEIGISFWTWTGLELLFVIILHRWCQCIHQKWFCCSCRFSYNRLCQTLHTGTLIFPHQFIQIAF